MAWGPVTAVQQGGADADVLVTQLFREHATALVRLARLFVDDRNAAEDLVQEAFLRLRRSAHRIEQPSKAAAYLRSIVLNLARDHNRRGLVSLRHREAARTDVDPALVDEGLELREDQASVVTAIRALPLRQRDCVVLRYYLELPVAEIAETLGLSANSVKTHLSRALDRLETELEARR